MPTSWAEWASFYEEGGGPMHVIAALGVVGLVLTLERWWRLCVGQRVNTRRVLAVVQSRLLAGDTEGALRCCSSSRSYVHRMVREGLRAGYDPVRTERAVLELRLSLEPDIRRWLPALSSLASLAMLVGLLGTVFGLIGGFHCAPLSADARAAALAQSIALAVHTSGFGILVGIVLLSLRLWLVDASNRLLANVALCGAKVVNLVRVITTPAPPARGPYRHDSPAQPCSMSVTTSAAGMGLLNR